MMASVSCGRGPVGLLPHGTVPAVVFKYMCLLENITVHLGHLPRYLAIGHLFLNYLQLFLLTPSG